MNGRDKALPLRQVVKLGDRAWWAVTEKSICVDCSDSSSVARTPSVGKEITTHHSEGNQLTALSRLPNENGLSLISITHHLPSMD